MFERDISTFQPQSSSEKQIQHSDKRSDQGIQRKQKQHFRVWIDNMKYRQLKNTPLRAWDRSSSQKGAHVGGASFLTILNPRLVFPIEESSAHHLYQRLLHYEAMWHDRRCHFTLFFFVAKFRMINFLRPPINYKPIWPQNTITNQNTRIKTMKRKFENNKVHKQCFSPGSSIQPSLLLYTRLFH